MSKSRQQIYRDLACKVQVVTEMNKTSASKVGGDKKISIKQIMKNHVINMAKNNALDTNRKIILKTRNSTFDLTKTSIKKEPMSLGQKMIVLGRTDSKYRRARQTN